MKPKAYDLAVIGGGINGCGIAADAALKGLSVVLIEQDDLASKTSSSSTKLIHGGLRYLEHYDFSLVKKAIKERQTLLNIAPHLIHPLPLVLPYIKKLRPAWLLRLGLFFYDHLSKENKLPKTVTVNRDQHPLLFAPIHPNYQKGFLFYDCRTNDSRLTIHNALQAKKFGASIHNYSSLVGATVKHNQWNLTIKPQKKSLYQLQAQAVVNATGPWVRETDLILQAKPHQLLLVKGSHLLVRKLYEGEQAYFLQHTDQRIIFVIPYQQHYSLIGTTESRFNSSLNKIELEEEEMNYLLEISNHYFTRTLSKKDIVHSWSGLRPIADDGRDLKALTRDYLYFYASDPAPLISIYGGKLTTYRQLAEEVLEQLRPLFPQMNCKKTNKVPLPGAASATLNIHAFAEATKQIYPWLPEYIRLRLLATYGSLMEQILKESYSLADLGQHFGGGLYEKEVHYLIEEEWARTVNDILWRRTQLGIEPNSININALTRYLSQYIT